MRQKEPGTAVMQRARRQKQQQYHKGGTSKKFGSSLCCSVFFICHTHFLRPIVKGRPGPAP